MGGYRDLTAPLLKTELPGPKVGEMMKYLSAFLPSYVMPFMKDTAWATAWYCAVMMKNFLTAFFALPSFSMRSSRFLNKDCFWSR